MRRQGPRPAMVVAWFLVVLLLTLGWGPGAVEAHPGMSGAIGVAREVPTAPADPAPVASMLPPLAPAAGMMTPGAWAWLTLLGLSAMALGGRQRHPALALTLALLLGVFACETAVHSAHHLKDPREAERCPVYSASQHVTGLTAAPATPDLPPPSPTGDRPVIRPGQLRAPELAGPQSRAPPALPV